MIVTEYIDKDTIRTYSDKGVYIHGGYPEGDYEEAIDPSGMNRIYTETDILIPTDDTVEEIDAEYVEVGKIMMGVIE